MAETQVLDSPTRVQLEQPIATSNFDTKIIGLFADRPSALKHIESVIAAPDHFTDNWWNGLYKWLDNNKFHNEKQSVSRITVESLDTLPPNAKLPRSLKHWISDINGFQELEPIRQQILDTLKNSSIPLSLRTQLGKQLSESIVTPYSVEPIMQCYRILGEDVGEEVKKQIFPLMLAGLAYEKYEPYKEDFIKLYEQTVSSHNQSNKRPLSRFLSRFKPKIHQEAKQPDAKEIERKRLTERRLEVTRNLVLESFPPSPSDQDSYHKFESLQWERLYPYTSSYSGGKTSGEIVSSDMLTLPLETLEKYLSDLRKLRELPEFANISSFSNEGIIAPYVALGRSCSAWNISEQKISITSALHYLNDLNKLEGLDDSVVDEFLFGMHVDISQDEKKTIARRNLRTSMKYQLPQTIRVNFDNLLTIPEENVFKDVLDTVVSMVHENQDVHKYGPIYYLASEDVINKLHDLSLKQEDVGVFLETYKALPPLGGQYLDELHREFCRQYSGKQTAQFFKDMNTAYSSFPNQFVSIVQLVGNSTISRETALELPAKIGDVLSNESLSLVLQHPKLFLIPNQGIEFFKEIMTAYKNDYEVLTSLLEIIEKKEISRELALNFPQLSSNLMNKNKQTFLFVIENAATLIKDDSDLRFLNNVVEELGEKSDIFIKTYKKLLVEGKITIQNKNSEFRRFKQFFKDASSPSHEEQTSSVDKELLKTNEVRDIEESLRLMDKIDILIEASLFIDQKFMRVALITENTQNPEIMFGDNEWMDYLEARKKSKEYGNQKLTRDFIIDLHRELTNRSNPKISGVIRHYPAKAADYNDPMKAVTYTQEQIEAIHSNPLLYFRREWPKTEHNTTFGFIDYPNPIVITEKLDELCQWYNHIKSTNDYNPFQIAALLQQKLVSIHPFSDANGSLSRLLMNWSLENDGEFPAILEEPNHDILTREGEWAKEVEEGSKLYHEIKKRQLIMNNLGINDVPAIFGLGQEYAFYEYIFKYIKKRPELVFNEGKLIHKEYNEFNNSFKGGFNLYNSLTRSNSTVKTEKEPSVLSQGGLISSSFIKFASATVPSTSMNSNNFFSDIDIYRGGVCREELTEEKLCNMFLNYVGLGSGYRALRKSGVGALSAQSVDSKKITESMDYYNKLIAAFFFNNLHIDDKNPYKNISDIKDLLLTLSYHIEGDPKNIWESPFASTSLDIGISRGWSVKGTDKLLYGIVFKSKVPKEGSLLTFGNDLPSISSVFLHPNEREILVAGGLQPSSIFEIEIYYDDTIIRTLIKIARRVDRSGISGIEIEDLREKSTRLYKFNSQIGRFELEAKETTKSLINVTV